MSISSLTSGEPDCSSLLDLDSFLDPDGFASPQHGGVGTARLRRSPAGGFRANLDSPGTPGRVFRHNSFSGQYSRSLVVTLLVWTHPTGSKSQGFSQCCF